MGHPNNEVLHFSPFCWRKLRGNLFAITHPTITSQRQPKTHPHVSTLLRNHMHPAFILHSKILLLSWTMGNTVCMTLQAKEAFLAFKRLESTCAHVARSVAQYSIPVKTDTLVEKRYPKINLEIIATLICVPVFLPLWLLNTLFSKKCHDSVEHEQPNPTPSKRSECTTG
jgi:hypothetical protein